MFLLRYMGQRNFISNIFTPGTKEHLLQISAPRLGEVDRVKKDIFRQLEIKYPQFRHRSLFVVDNLRFPRFSFGFMLMFVICISGYLAVSVLPKGNDDSGKVAEISSRTISPDETVLVQNNDLVQASDLMGGVAGVVPGIENNVSPSSKKVSGVSLSSVASRGIQSLDSDVGGTQPSVSRVQTVSDGIYSTRKEGSVSAAAGSGQQVILEDIDNSVQIEYLVELR